MLLRSQILSARGGALHRRLLHVRGFGNGMWCHDEAHRTQHHRLHEERFSRL